MLACGTMNANIITIERIETLAVLLENASERLAEIAYNAHESITTPDEAADEINEIMRNLNAANS